MPEPAVATPPAQGPTAVPIPSTDLGGSGGAGVPAPTLHENTPMRDAFSDLSKLFGDPEPPKKAEDKQPAEPKEEAPKPDEQKVDEQPKAPEKTQEKPSEKAVTAPELRKAYENLKKEHSTLKAELASRSKVPEEFQQAQAQIKTLSERLEAAEKRARDLDEEMRFSNYERSGEFKDKYEQPFIDAYQAGRTKTTSFRVTDAEGNVRQGTEDDFDRIMQMSSDDDAANAARELFGDTKASIILMHREKILDLHSARLRAVENYRKTGSEREKQTAEQRERQNRTLGEMWTKLNAQATEKYPHWFKEIDGDDAGNELLKKGYELADLAFNGADKLSPEQTVQLHSSLRNRAAAFGRLAYQNRNLQAEVTALKKELEEYKASEPGKGDGAKPNGQPENDSWESQLEQLASRS